MLASRPSLLAAAALVSLATAAHAASPVIDHSEIKCLVVGKYRKMPAKFSPADVAQPRVYFRPEGVPSWYYVEMKPEDPLGHVGVLPKPTKTLVKKHIEYYVEAASKDFDSGRTPEYAPIVVAKEGDCDRDPLVPLYSKNPPSAVFPSLPQGFAMGGAAGIGTAAAVVGGGAAAAGAAILATRDGDDGGTSSASSTIPTTVTTPPVTTVPPTTITQPPGSQVSCQADVREGPVPLTVKFNAQANGVVDYFWDFGDGGTSTQVNPTHTFTVAGVYQVTVRASIGGALVDTCTRTVTALAVAPPPPAPLTVTIVGAGTVSGSGIACAPDCTESFPVGSVVTLTAAPSAGSSFGGFSGDCSGVVCTVTMDGPRNVTATFTPPAPTFALTVALAGTGTGTVTGPGINCPGDCTETYPAGTPVALTATADVTSTFAGFNGDCTGTTCNLTMNAPRNVTATFNLAASSFPLTVTLAGVGTGTVTGPGIACPGDCTENQPAGTPVVLTATPTGGSIFMGFTGDCTGPTCNLTMNGPRNVTATFTVTAPFTLAVSVGGGGTGTLTGPGINCPSDCGESYPPGTPVALTATPTGGATLGGWTGDCVGTSGFVCNLTMTANRTAGVTFNPPTVLLTLTVTGPGTAGTQVVAFPPAQTCGGTPAPGNTCTVPYTLGASATLVPNTVGGLVASWGGDCAGTTPGANCMLVMSANRTADATFVPAVVPEPVRTGSTVVSRLEAAGARVAATLNETPLPPPSSGASTWTVVPRAGDNRIDAQTQAGAAGTWRLELAGVSGLEKGSLRVLAGEVVSVGPDAVVFRLKGRPGERMSLAFTVR